MRRRLVPLLALASACLAACGGGQAPEAASESASRLLAAAMKGDRVAFEAEIDRAAVREDVRRQVTELARGSALDVEGGPSEFALDRMIAPEAIRLVGGAGRALTHAPTPAEVAPLLRMEGDKRACLKAADGACALTFAKAGRRWRLVGMKAMDLRIQVAGAGA